MHAANTLDFISGIPNKYHTRKKKTIKWYLIIYQRFEYILKNTDRKLKKRDVLSFDKKNYHDPISWLHGMLVHCPSNDLSMRTTILTSFPKVWCTVPCSPIVIFPGIIIGEGDTEADVKVMYGWAVVHARKSKQCLFKFIDLFIRTKWKTL